METFLILVVSIVLVILAATNFKLASNNSKKKNR